MMHRGHAPEDIVPRYLDELTGCVVGGGVTGEVILTCVCARMCVCVCCGYCGGVQEA